jgi:hypothetical protein
MRLCSCIFVLLAALLVCSATNRLHAQATAEITGTIIDNSGAVVPGARVSITNEATGISSEVTSNAAGHYTVPFLRPGRYRIEVQQEGFRTVSRAGVLLQVAQAPSWNAAFRQGSAY